MNACAVCGKDMTQPNGGRTVGIELWVETTGETSPAMRKHLQEQLGPYDLDRRYSICWECWMRSLGVKP